MGNKEKAIEGSDGDKKSITPFFVAFHSSHAPSAVLSSCATLGYLPCAGEAGTGPERLKAVAKVTQCVRGRAVVEVSSHSCKASD